MDLPYENFIGIQKVIPFVNQTKCPVFERFQMGSDDQTIQPSDFV